MSNFTLNEKIVALATTVWGVWAAYLVLVMPWSTVRFFFTIILLLPGLALGILQLPWVHRRLDITNWDDLPVTVRVRIGIYIMLSWSLSLVGIAICLGNSTRPIHSIMYFAMSLICAGKALRMANYDR